MEVSKVFMAAIVCFERWRRKPRNKTDCRMVRVEVVEYLRFELKNLCTILSRLDKRVVTPLLVEMDEERNCGRQNSVLVFGSFYYYSLQERFLVLEDLHWMTTDVEE